MEIPAGSPTAPLTAYTSGDPAAFARFAATHVPELTFAHVGAVRWREGRLVVAPAQEPQTE
jgi:hypothetical protein